MSVSSDMIRVKFHQLCSSNVPDHLPEAARLASDNKLFELLLQQADKYFSIKKDIGAAGYFYSQIVSGTGLECSWSFNSYVPLKPNEKNSKEHNQLIAKACFGLAKCIEEGPGNFNASLLNIDNALAFDPDLKEAQEARQEVKRKIEEQEIERAKLRQAEEEDAAARSAQRQKATDAAKVCGHGGCMYNAWWGNANACPNAPASRAAALESSGAEVADVGKKTVKNP